MKPQQLHTLPDGWEMKRLGEVCAKILDGTHFSPQSKEGEYLYITSKNIRDDGLDLSDVAFISKTEHSDIYRRCPVMYGDVLLTKDGAGTGASCLNTLQEPFSLLSSVAVLRGTPDKLLNSFLLNLIKSPHGQTEIQNAISGQAITRITLEKIKKFKFPLPPLAEQRQIAAVLGTWDRAIEQTTDLLRTLRTRHRGLMHRLLTGQVRLPGYVGEWRQLEIYEVAHEVSLRNRNDRPLTVLSCTKYDGLVDSLDYFGRKIYSDDLTTYKIVAKGQFAYATNHIEEGSIGYQSRYEAALISPMYTVFSTDSSVEDSYLYYLLKSNRYIQEYKRNMVGSIDRRGGLRWSDFSKIVIHLPTVTEQRAIADVLDASLREIRQHEAKLEALREQKRGLMQCLLTGQVRVPVTA